MWCKELKSRVLVAQPPRQCIIKTWENCQAYKIFSPISTCIKKEEIMIFTSAQYSCEKRRKEGGKKCAILPVFFFFTGTYVSTCIQVHSVAFSFPSYYHHQLQLSGSSSYHNTTRWNKVAGRGRGRQERREGKRGWASSHHLVGRFTYSIAVLLNLTSQPLAQFPVIPRCGYPSSIIIIITTIITTFYWH